MLKEKTESALIIEIDQTKRKMKSLVEETLRSEQKESLTKSTELDEREAIEEREKKITKMRENMVKDLKRLQKTYEE